MIRAPFAEETSAEIPSSNRWLDAGGRRVKVYARGPHRGVDADTGICLLLHGYDQQPSDKAWQLLRRSIANAHNMLVISLDYFGSEITHPSQVFLYQQLYAIFKSAANDAEFGARLRKGEELDLPEEDFWYFENHIAAVNASLAYPSTYADWGVLQSLDAINALAWAAQESGLMPKRVPIVAIGEGAQIAYMLLKLMPRSFSGLIDLSGYAYAGAKMPWLAKMLDSCALRPSEHEQGKAAFTLEEFASPIRVSRRWPKPMLGHAIGNGASFEAEVALRDVTKAEHFPKASSLVMIRAEGREEDAGFPPAYRESLMAPYRALGVDCEFRGLSPETCGTPLRDAKGHPSVESLKTILNEDYPEVFKAQLKGDASEGFTSGAERAFSCGAGTFILTTSSPASLRFEQGRPKKKKKKKK